MFINRWFAGTLDVEDDDTTRSLIEGSQAVSMCKWISAVLSPLPRKKGPSVRPSDFSINEIIVFSFDDAREVT